MEKLQLDYYYGIESQQFSFFRVPRLLVKDERFKGLCSDAKLLYGLMLDRMSLSMKRGWMDKENRAFIIYTVEEIMDDLGCSKPTAIKIVKELDCENGIGLIERIRRGLGKADLIYVKNFTSIENAIENDGENDLAEEIEPTEVKNLYLSETDEFTATSKNIEPAEVKNLYLSETDEFTAASKNDESTEVKNLYFSDTDGFTTVSKENELPEVKDFYLQKSKNFTSGSTKIEPLEVKESDPSYTNISYTNKSYNNFIQSIGDSKPSLAARLDQMDEAAAYRELIKKNISYDHYMTYCNSSTKELYNELYQLICEVVCLKTDTVKINGQVYPYDVVKSQFLKLNSSHLEYVIDSLEKTNTKISNIKSYMLTALYNAPNTIDLYYKQLVQHDMYGGARNEQGII